MGFRAVAENQDEKHFKQQMDHLAGEGPQAGHPAVTNCPRFLSISECSSSVSRMSHLRISNMF